MSYSENEKGEILLTMNRGDYELLCMALGSAIAIAGSDQPLGVPISILIPMVNRLMSGNPNWTPYAVRQQ